MVVDLTVSPPPGKWSETTYRGYGWVRPGSPLNFQRDDQGRDFVIAWRGIIQAPGNWECVNILSDAAFPDGFGRHYCVVFIKDGPYGGHAFYIGHCTALVDKGQSGGFGDALARADQGRPSQIGISVPGDGGWVELGEAFLRDGEWLPGPVTGRKWFDPILERDLVVVHDPNHYLWYPRAVPIFGHVWNERWVATRYDVLRARQTKEKHPNRAELAVLRKHAGYLAGRIWREAHKSHPVAWDDDRHFGFREQEMLKRRNGERVA